MTEHYIKPESFRPFSVENVVLMILAIDCHLSKILEKTIAHIEDTIKSQANN